MMKDKKFIIVDAKNINIVLSDIKLNSAKLFNAKNIPEKYQKIILKITLNSIIEQGDAQEFLTGVPFDLTGKEITIDNDKKIIHGINNELSLDIKAPLEKEDINKIINFYNELKNNELIEKYVYVLNSLFRTNVNLDKSESKILNLKHKARR